MVLQHCLNHKSGCKLFARYVDDIIRTVRSTEVDSLLGYFNQMHVNLKFTIERSLNHEIPFLDMVVSQSGNRLSTRWYRKPTDTGTTLSFRALAPMRYKRNIIS